MDPNIVSLPSPEQIEDLIQRGEIETLRELLAEYHPADIVDILESLEPEHAILVFSLLPDYEASEVLDETNSLLRAELVEKVEDERLADLLDTLPMDDAAEFLEDLPDETSERLLDLMEPEEAEEVRQLLSYEEDTAGRLMTRDVIALRRQWTVAQAEEYLRSLDDPEMVHYLYVVDVIGRLIGVVPIRNLILAQPNEYIEHIMIDKVISVSVSADEAEVAELISRYDFYAIPVVGDDDKLLGVITVDDALDVLEEEATEDIQRLGGSEPLEQPYFSASVPLIVQKRIVWLLLLFLASFLSASVIDGFEGLIVQFAILANFIPLITGTGGNAGSQTWSTIIRAIATGEVRLNDVWRALFREIATGLLLGVMLGMIGFGFVMFAGWVGIWQGVTVQLGMVVALALPIVVIWAVAIATIIPIVAEKVGIDPPVVSSPMIATIVDATGLLIYFTLASIILL